MADPISTRHRVALGTLTLVGAVVLLGQLWPAGAPPFARAVNIGWVALVLGYLLARLLGRL